MSSSSVNNAAARPLDENEGFAPSRKKRAIEDKLLSPSEFKEVFGIDPAAHPSSEFASQWLAWQCRMLSGVQAGAVFLKDRVKGATLQAVACWPNDTEEIPYLRKIATEAILGRAGIIQKRQDDGIAGVAINDGVAYPVLVQDQVIGTVALTLTVRSEPQQKAVLQLLQWGIVWLESILAEGAKSRGERAPAILESVGRALQSKPLPLLANELCTGMADDFDCGRVALGLVKGLQVQVIAVSHQLRFDRRVERVAEFEAAMEECVDQDRPITVPAHADAGQVLSRAHSELLQGHESLSVCSVPLRDGEKVVAVLSLLGTSKKQFDENAVTAFSEAAVLLGPVLALRLRDEESVWRKFVCAGRAKAAKLFGAGHLGYKATVGAAIFSLLLLSLLEADHRVSARSSVEGSVQQAIVAPQAGYVAAAQARAGDVVEEGFVLATLDDRDLLLEQEKWTSERDKHAREHQEALAMRDRARVSVLAARMAQADAQLHLVEEKLRRTQLRAPFAGILVSGDLSRALGAPVERGQLLFELAPLEGYRVALKVDEHDMADLKPGQTGTLRLTGFPDQTLSLSVDRIVPVATAEEGGNYFRVEAELIDPPKELRPGMEGVAKLVVGRASLIWIWTHEVWDRLRLWAWNLGV